MLALIRRTLQAIGVLFAIGLIAFTTFRFAGDPVNQMVGMDTPTGRARRDPAFARP
jgi:peptide/nickel transport system permease protein